MIGQNLFPDDVIRARNSDIDVIATGTPGCAITHLIRHGAAYDLRALASVAHLPSGHADVSRQPARLGIHNKTSTTAAVTRTLRLPSDQTQRS